MDGENQTAVRRRRNNGSAKRKDRSKSPFVRDVQRSSDNLESAATTKVAEEQSVVAVSKDHLNIRDIMNSQRPSSNNGSSDSSSSSKDPTPSDAGENNGGIQESPSIANNSIFGSFLDSWSSTNGISTGNGQSNDVPGSNCPSQSQGGSSPLLEVDGDQRLALLQFSILLGRALEEFVRLIAKYWVDEHGNGPLGRFLRFDTPIGGIGPTKRIVWFLFVGFFLSIAALVLTEDEYYTGPKVDKTLTSEQSETSDFYPMHISFENLGCYVQNVGWVLANVSGDARPGRLMGILGASGSGKTTLAHALLGRSRRSCTISTGTVYLNGAPGSLDSFVDRVGFVPQDDVLYAEMTVMEALRFSAHSRLPRYLSDKYVDDIIQKTINTLDLNHVLNNFIGSEMTRGLSGGERKRVSIGVELVTLPSVLVLDEPTSGLDGAQAHKLIGTLKEIASRFNVSVVTVIHQPSARSFSLLDDIILLQKGRLVYYGERGEAIGYFSSLSSLKDYFRSSNITAGTVEALSPAEILLDISTGFTVLNTDFAKSEHFKRKEKEIREREKHFRMAAKSLLPDTVDVDLEDEVQRSILKERCGGYKSDLLRTLCNIKSGLAFTLGLEYLEGAPSLRYTKRAKRGIIFQSGQWFVLLWKLAFRRGVKVELFSVLTLAATCAYMRHFNRSWQRKPVSAFYISVSLGLIAMIGAALEDDILPVRRAVASGMLLGAHEFALLLFSLFKGNFIAHLFSMAFFGVRYLLDPPPSAKAQGIEREFCCTPFSWRTYLRFHHLVQLNYFCARGFALLLNVLVDHDEKKSMVASCAFLIGAHAFSLYSPQMSQLLKDGVCIYGVNISQPMLFLCSFSYVRYFLEAMFLWDPEPYDKVGRDFALRYFAYKEDSEAACATTMSHLIVAGQVVRFVLFAFRNANDYASFHDAPAFLIFLGKILLVYGVVLIAAIIFHEAADLRRAWDASVGVALRRRPSLSS